MLVLLTDLPPNVLGVEAIGKIEASDYRAVLEPAVEAALAAHDKVRLLFVLGEQYEGYSVEASWEDAKLGLGHWGSWERIALVTDHEWVAGTVKALAWMLPGKVRVFGNEDREAAAVWVAAE
jgi:SpoIIAA-like